MLLLTFQTRSRIIALAKAPFNVVQVNAAFLRLTNSTSTADYLGKPLQELTEGSSLISALNDSLTTCQKVSIPGHESFHCVKQRLRRISVVPVGAPGLHDVQITHFAIKIRCSDRSSSTASSSTSSSSDRALVRNSDITEALNTLSSDAIYVMG
jgi:hypothetical protein